MINGYSPFREYLRHQTTCPLFARQKPALHVSGSISFGYFLTTQLGITHAIFESKTSAKPSVHVFALTIVSGIAKSSLQDPLGFDKDSSWYVVKRNVDVLVDCDKEREGPISLV